jgi:hypothetical protein
MEQRMALLGYPSKTKPEKKEPASLEAGLIEIGYLKALEAVERKRQHTLLKVFNASVAYAQALQKERLSLERNYVRVEKLPSLRHEPVQTIQFSREEVLDSWEDKSQAQIDKMIADLEALVKG